jgi:hypothetical protein
MLKPWRQWWRLFLLAWLTLAIPTQGFAAATKALCPQHVNGHGSVSMADMGHTAHAHLGEDHSDHPGAHQEAHSQAKATQCSACGTCCAALGMPAQMTVAFQPPMVQAPLPAGSPRLSLSFFTDGPERPPKAPHA